MYYSEACTYQEPYSVDNVEKPHTTHFSVDKINIVLYIFLYFILIWRVSASCEADMKAIIHENFTH